jgi:DNA-binding response OmpR family regulator
MLTAKGEDVDRIVGLEMGADDYLAKPFNPRELGGAHPGVLRRHGEHVVPGAPAEKAPFRSAAIRSTWPRARFRSRARA